MIDSANSFHRLKLSLAALCLAFLSSLAYAQKSETFDAFELHYSVVNTTFLSPQVAATYNITRGKKNAILNLALRENLEVPLKENVEPGVEIEIETEARSMQLTGRTWDLIQGQKLTFQEVREGEAIYYIAQFTFINEEWRFFEFDFQPAGSDKTYTYKFKHQLYIN